MLVLAGLLFLIFASTTVGDLYGTSTWPVTFQMLGLLSGSFAAFMLIIIAFYAGELVWRERDNRLDQISDALPTPTWLPLVSKLGALMLVPAVLQVGADALRHGDPGGRRATPASSPGSTCTTCSPSTW